MPFRPVRDLQALALSALLALSGCASPTPQFQDGLRNITGLGADTARLDAVAMSTSLATRVKQEDPPPRGLWETVLPDDAADLLQLVGTRQLLVGVVEIDGDLGAPRHGPVQMHDAETGALLWKATRPPYPRGQYVVLSTSPSIVLLGSDAEGAELFALDPASGERRWAHALKGPFQAAVTPDGEQIVLAAPAGTRYRVQAVGLATGSVSWSTELDGAVATARAPALLAGEGSVYVVGARLIRLEPRAGKVVWAMEHAILRSRAVSAMVLPDGLLLWDSDSAATVRAADGRNGWARAFDGGSTRLLATAGGKLIRIGRRPRSDVLELVDPQTGRVLWARDAGGFVASGVASDGDAVFYSTDDAVLGLELATGMRRFRSAIPLSLLRHPVKFRLIPSAEPAALPDQIRVRAGTLLLAREGNGVAAYDVAAGKPRWAHAVTDYHFSNLRSHMALEAGERQARGGRPAPRAGVPTVRATSDSALRMAQSNYDASRSRYQAAQGNPGATRSERATARGGYLMASRQLEIQERLAASSASIEASLALGAAGIALADALVAAKQARDAAAGEAAVQRARLGLSGVYNVWTSGFQERFYVQPFGKIERGITLVDLDTGTRRDVVYALLSLPEISYGIGFQNYVVDLERRRLYAAGTSLNPERYRAQVKWQMSKPRSSLLAYDLGPLALEPSTRRQDEIARSLPESNDIRKRSLASLILNKDTYGIQRAIEAGMDINAAEPTTGITPIYMAATTGDPGVVRLLLEHGADPAVRAKDGLSAVDVAGRLPTPEIRNMLLEAARRKQ